MKTKKYVLIAVLCISGVSLFAQQETSFRRNDLGHRVEKAEQNQRKHPGQNTKPQLVQALNLSLEQTQKLEKLQQVYAKKDSMAFVAFRKQQEQQHLDRMKAFKSILNKEQLEEFEKMQLLRADRALFKTERPEGAKSHQNVMQKRRPDKKMNGRRTFGGKQEGHHLKQDGGSNESQKTVKNPNLESERK